MCQFYNIKYLVDEFEIPTARIIHSKRNKGKTKEQKQIMEFRKPDEIEHTALYSHFTKERKRERKRKNLNEQTEMNKWEQQPE